MEPYAKLSTRDVVLASRSYMKIGDGQRTLLTNSGALLTLETYFSGFRNPSWKDLIRSQFNATTPASGTKEETLEVDGELYVKFYNTLTGLNEEYWTEGCIAFDDATKAISPPSVPVLDEVNNKALTLFLRKCKNAQSQMQSGVFLGELKQTIGLIRNPLKGLRSLFTDYVHAARRRPPRGVPVRRHVQDQWLELQFGALPLISDVESGVAALVRYRNKRAIAPVRAYAQADHNSLSGAINRFQRGYQVLYSHDHVYSRLLKGGVFCQSNGGPTEVRQAFGLTIRDFVPTIYNLIPYSFVLDYFSNVGNIIDCWSFCIADLAWHTDSRRWEDRSFYNTVHVIPQPSHLLPIAFSAKPSTVLSRRRNFVRQSLPLGLPSLGFRLPGTSTKFLNLAALAGSRVR